MMGNILQTLSNAGTDSDILQTISADHPNLFVNPAFSSFFFSSQSSSLKADAILSAFKAREYIEKNRPHNRGQALNSYDVYCNFSKPEYRLPREEFESVFSDFLSIVLNNSELACSPKVLQATQHLLHSGESPEEITYFLQFLVTNPLATFNPKKKYDDFSLEMDRKMAYQDVRNQFMPIQSNVLEALCALEAATDVVFENTAVLQLFSTKLGSNNAVTAPIFIIDPSIHFVRRLKRNNPFNHSTVCFFLRSAAHVHVLNGLQKNTSFRFYSLSELDAVLCSGTSVPSDTLFFGSHSVNLPEKAEIINKLLSYTRTAHSLFLLDSDFGIESEKSPERNALLQTSFAAAWLFPSGLNEASKPEQKILLHVDYGYLNSTPPEFVITQYSLVTNKKEQVLSPHVFNASISKGDYMSAKKSLRSVFRAQFMASQAKTDSSRHSAETYEYSPEITVYYTHSGVGSDEQPYRLSAFVREPQVGNGKPPIIKGCRKSPKKIRVEDAESWIESDYMSDDGIHKLIADCYLPYYNGCEITLKSFLYFNLAWTGKLTKSEQADIRFFSSSVLGGLPLSQITLDDAITVIEADAERISSRISLLSDAFNLAIQHGNCSSNPIKPYLQEIRSKRKGFYDVRDNLAAKHFTLSQCSALFNKWRKAYAKGSLLHLAALTCLLTGLDANIVCALRWKDFHLVEIVNKINFYQFFIRRQACNDGSEINSFVNRDLYRDVPCPAWLAGKLSEEKEKADLIHAGMPQGYVDEQFIFAENNKPFSPAKLSKAMRKTIKELNIPPEVISIPDSKKGTVETNLTDFAGHIFRTNFDFYARYYGKMDICEIEYLLGLRPSTTFSAHYCDYGNDYAQLILFAKMERISNLILSDSNFRAAKRHLDIHRSESFSTAANSQGRTVLNMDFVNSGGTAEITVNTKFGSIITVQETDTL